MSKRKVLWVSEEAWRAASERARVSGESLADAASRLVLIGGRRARALAKHRATTRKERRAVAP